MISFIADPVRGLAEDAIVGLALGDEDQQAEADQGRAARAQEEPLDLQPEEIGTTRDREANPAPGLGHK